MNYKKSNLKSIRLTDKVLNYINEYRGDGFNEKFENIILDAMESEDERIARLKMFDKLIEEEKQRYYKMCGNLNRLDPMIRACLDVDTRIRELNRLFDDCISKIFEDPGNLQNK